MTLISPAHPIKCVLFDLDGVLVRSEHLYHEAKIQTLKNYGIDISLLALNPYQGQTDFAFFQSLLKSFPGLSVTARDLANESGRIFKEELHHKMEPMPDAVRFIRSLRDRNITIGNVTSASSHSQDFALRMMKVDHEFEVKISADDVDEHKPHPAPYLLALKKVSLPPEECIVIEDTISGIRSARAAGIQVIGFGETFSDEILINAGAQYFSPTYTHLMQVLDYRKLQSP